MEEEIITNIYSEKSQRNLRIIIAAAAAAALTAWIVLSLLGYRPEATAADVAAGRNYIDTVNAQDVSETETEVRQVRKTRLAAQRLQKINDMLNGDVSVWSLFQDYVFLGDSRTVGLYTWGYLPESRVIAASGATILFAEEHLEDIRAINPDTIILAFGLNDVSIGIWHTPEEYAEEYHKVLDEIQAECPNATIFVNSIFPAEDPAFEKASSWREIPQYSAALKSMCEEAGYPFIDNDEIAAEHADDYDIDGIHFKTDLYELWGENMIRTIYTWDGSDDEETSGSGDDSDDSDTSQESGTSESSESSGGSSDTESRN